MSNARSLSTLPEQWSLRSQRTIRSSLRRYRLVARRICRSGRRFGDRVAYKDCCPPGFGRGIQRTRGGLSQAQQSADCWAVTAPVSSASPTPPNSPPLPRSSVDLLRRRGVLSVPVIMRWATMAAMSEPWLALIATLGGAPLSLVEWPDSQRHVVRALDLGRDNDISPLETVLVDEDALVLNALAESGPVTLTRLATLVKRAPKSVSNRLARHRREGRVQIVDRKQWVASQSTRAV